MKILNKLVISWFFFGATSIASLSAQEILKPATAITTRSFAIIIDQQTYKACAPEVHAYKSAIEKENLPTFIVAHNWTSPEQVKAEIADLYQHHKLEGIVLIGDIPIAMMRKAQHLATAFKMDEKYDIKDSSIPSDRYYDDFDLTFDFLKQDPNDSLLFYYDLGIHSANKIQSDIYSGRIKPIKAADKDPYQQISSYLRKIVAAKAGENKIDNVFAYLGDGTLSNSLAAWSPELYRLEEQFPNTFTKSTQAQVYRFDTWNFPKHEIINQLKRKDLDVALFHEHGVPERMYISGDFSTHYSDDHFAALAYYFKKIAAREINGDVTPEDFYQKFVSKYNFSPAIFNGYDTEHFSHQDSLRFQEQGIDVSEIDAIKPNTKLTIFDACYNGDFREHDYVAGRFIFSEGDALVALANTVSILQDVNTVHLIGLLNLGYNVGQWAQLNHVLESHVIGDPTFTFTPENSASMQWVYKETDNNKLIEALKTATDAEHKNGILTQLYINNYAELPALLADEYNRSSFITTRYTCLHLANQLQGDIQLTLLKKGITDSDEFIRRHSINTMARVGDPTLIPYLMDAYLANQHASRILFALKMALYSFDKDLIKKCAAEKFRDAYVLDKAEFEKDFFAGQFQGFYHDLDSTIFTDKSTWRKFGIASLKNVNYHPSVDKYIAFVKDAKQKEDLRIAMLEALAWFGNSYRKNEIVDACQEIVADTTYSEAIRNQSLRTLKTIQ